MTAANTDTPRHEFNPDRAVHPGELIRELLDEIGMKQAHLAGACTVSPKHVNQVIQGVKPLHARLAVSIEFATGKPIANVLMRMQADYDVWTARLEAVERAKALTEYFDAKYPTVREAADV